MKLFDDNPLAAQAQLLVDRLMCLKEFVFRRAEYGQLCQRVFVWLDDPLGVAPAAGLRAP